MFPGFDRKKPGENRLDSLVLLGQVAQNAKLHVAVGAAMGAKVRDQGCASAPDLHFDFARI